MEKKLSACVRCCISYLTPTQIKEICYRFLNNIIIDVDYDNDFLNDYQFKRDFNNSINNMIYQELESINNIRYISSKYDTNLYIWKKDKILYITFRGTSSLVDVFIDLKCFPKNIKDKICVHQGFYDQFLSVEKQITGELDKHIDDIDEIIISGHSLGGGCATIASAYYGEKYSNKTVSCITFGCPRVGNKKFIEWFSKNVNNNIRIVNKNDPITMIPTSFLWNHTFNDCIILRGEDNNIQICKRDTPWFLRFFHLLFKVNYFNPIKNHSLSLYISKLQNLK